MTIQAGTVIGGSQLRKVPQAPRSRNRVRFGRRSAYRSKTRVGSAQSRPMTTTLGACAWDIARSLGGEDPSPRPSRRPRGEGILSNASDVLISLRVLLAPGDFQVV